MVIGKGRFYDPKEGILPAVRLKNQQESLREIISHFYSHASFVRKLLDRAGVRPFEVRTAADLERIPITRKNEVIEAQKSDPPYGGLLAVPADEIERVFISPGPIYEIQPSDINWFASSFYAAGFRKGDIVINTFTYHMSPAGLMFHLSLIHI